MSSTTIPHSPLSRDPDQIRILILEPATSGDLHCQFTSAELHSNGASLPYETVSYVWGTNPNRTLINVGGHNIEVPSSSAAVLHRIRLPDRARAIWIDAVCINQSDAAERSHQVSIMKKVYNHATGNLVFWSEDDDEAPWAESAIRSVRDIVADGIQGEFLRLLFHNGVYSGGISEQDVVNCSYDESALIKLYATPWMRRLWTYQEACLPKKNTCFVGAFEVELLTILRAGMWLMYNFTFISTDLKRALRVAAVDHLIMDMDPEYGVPKYYPGVARHPLAIARKARDRQASEPRDKIYGCLGLTPSLDILVDYNSSVASVYQTFVMATINKRKDLTILDDVGFRQGALEAESDLPSWVPDFNVSFDDQHGPYRWGIAYNAADNHAARASFENHPSGKAILISPGARVGKVQTVTTPDAVLIEGSMFRSRGVPSHRQLAADALGLPLQDEQTDLALALTLLAGRDWQDNHPTDEAALNDFRAWARYADANEDVRQDWALAPTATPEQAAASRFAEAAGFATNHRRVFATDGGHLGLAPRYIAEGDVVALLYGAKWPAILRPLQDGFLFAGYAWIYGMMEGEFMRQHTESGKADEVFKLH